MSPNIDPRIAAAWTECIVIALTERLRASTPMLSWHGRRTDGCGVISEGASAFLIRTPAGILGVTAAHVVDGFVAARSFSKDITATLGGFSFDLKERLIKRGENVDIATFRISEADLPTIGFQPLEQAWPPVMPASDGVVLLAGWPGHERIVVAERVTGGIYIGWGSADVQASGIIRVLVDHGQGPTSPIPGVPLPQSGFNFGGISGGPLMLIDAEDDAHKIRWRVAGVIVQGIPNYDCIYATHADVIQDDGHISE